MRRRLVHPAKSAGFAMTQEKVLLSDKRFLQRFEILAMTIAKYVSYITPGFDVTIHTRMFPHQAHYNIVVSVYSVTNH